LSGHAWAAQVCNEIIDSRGGGIRWEDIAGLQHAKETVRSFNGLGL
jgi:hypothetical protein